MRNILKARTPEEQMKKLFFDNLNRIYKMSKAVLKGWKTTAIPLDSLKTIIDMSYYDIDELKKELKQKNASKNASKRAIELYTVFNNTLGSLYTTSEKQAKHMETKSIPLHILKNSLDEIKKVFNTGLKEG